MTAECSETLTAQTLDLNSAVCARLAGPFVEGPDFAIGQDQHHAMTVGQAIGLHGRMQVEDPRNPFLQYFLTCQNFGAITASARDALAMIYLVKPGAKRHAYIREDSPGAVIDKVKNFFGY